MLNIQKLETEVRDFYQTRHKIFAKIYKKIIEVFKYVWVIERPLANDIFIVFFGKINEIMDNNVISLVNLRISILISLLFDQNE